MSERVRITVIEEKNKNARELFHDRGRTLLHTLREGGVNLPSLCSSLGKCGRCQIRFRGYAPLPTQADRAMIAPDKLRDGYRLACMARPGKNCVVEIAFEKEREIDVVIADRIENGGQGGQSGERKKKTPDIGKNERCGNGLKDRKEGRQIRAVAVADIGTTTIAVQMIETESGKILDTYTCLNPQRSYGLDVISRIQAGMEGHGEKLRQYVREALASGIREMIKRGEGQWKLAYTVISANTVMGHLFMGYPVETLGRSPFEPVNIRTVKTDYMGMPAVLVPGISAFVGGDIVSGLYACGLNRKKSKGAWLFLDLGTNAEMVMGDGKRIVCTAAAAGPAFEGRGRYGAAGAERISAIAYLLEGRIIDHTGLLAEPYFETGIEVETGKERRKVRISREDVRDIQMAKAAVRAGIHFLMEHLEVRRYEEIEKVYVAGGFGFYLDKKAAAGIGLIPPALMDKMETVGNTSLAGARLLAGEIFREWAGGEEDWAVMDELEKIAQGAESFQLAEEPAFEKAYVDFMNFGI